MNTCNKCVFYEPPNKCQLPLSLPLKSHKTAREHYRHYFGIPCPRDNNGKLKNRGE